MDMSPGGSSTVIVTGAAGFIGARLAARLIEEGENVVAVDAPHHFDTRPEISFIYRDKYPVEILDLESLPRWMEKSGSSKIAGIIHMGACTDTTESDESLLERMNTSYTRCLWEWAARLEIPFLYASSAAVYGNGEQGYDDETPPSTFTPLNPYGKSKLRFDIWAASEGQQFRPPTWAGFRFFNVYGFGEAHKKKMASVFYQAFSQITERGEMRLFRSHKEGISDGFQSRDFIFVEDVVDVLCHAWQKGLPDGFYNLGTGVARTFLDLAHAVFDAMGREPRVVFIDTPLGIREQYQYFTKAKMDKLLESGFTGSFTSIEEGSQRYWEQLKKSPASPVNKRP